MILNVIANDQSHQVNIPDQLVEQAVDFFAKMDQDMDKGWQLGRRWLEKPSLEERCCIAADKLYTAMHTNDKKLAALMAGYIVVRAPGIDTIAIDLSGEGEHELIMDAGHPPVTTPPPRPDNAPLSKLDAMERAGQEISRVYKSGRQYKFALLNARTGQWDETIVAGGEEEAEQLRMQAFEKRFHELMGQG